MPNLITWTIINYKNNRWTIATLLYHFLNKSNSILGGEIVAKPHEVGKFGARQLAGEDDF